MTGEGGGRNGGKREGVEGKEGVRKERRGWKGGMKERGEGERKRDGGGYKGLKGRAIDINFLTLSFKTGSKTLKIDFQILIFI